MIEHEVAKRVPYGVWIEEASGGIPSFYLAHGLSQEGLQLRAKHPPQVGLPLSMRLVVENERRVVALQGEVVTANTKERSFAVRFLDLDDDKQVFLEELIEETGDI